jgi:hypothetical protein
MVISEPILVDTSVWINFWKGKKTPSVDLLTYSMLEYDRVWYCPTIIQEALQGLNDFKQFEKYLKVFGGFNTVPCQHYHAHTEAAKMYFTLRKKGITIRKPNDCLIAFYSLENDLILVHDDIDFERIKEVYPLKTFH